MKTSLNAPTKYEQTRIDALRKLGCSACAVLGVPNLERLELNHLLEGGVRMGHWYTIFLCRGHHQGDWTSEQLEWIEPKQRFAITNGRKLFNEVYGSERSLWERAQKKLKLPMVWPVSKIVPRRLHDIAATDGRLVGVSTGEVDFPQAHAAGSGSAVPADARDAQAGGSDSGRAAS